MNSKTKNILGFIAILLGTFISQIDSTIVNIASPTIGAYMNSSIKTTSWIASIYALALGVLLITASKIADQFGRKKFFLYGIIIFCLSSIFCATSSSIGMLIFFRALQGVGAAILTPIVIPMAVNIFGSNKNALLSAAFGGTSAFAASLGGPVGGFLTQYLSWKWIFLINVPICIAAFIITLFCIKESYDETTSKKIDFKGNLLLTAGLFLLVFSLIKATDYGIGSPSIISMFAGSLVLLAAFFYTEKRVKAPMLDLKLFTERNYRNSTICVMFLGLALAPSMFLINYFMNNILGYNSLKTGITICSMALTCMIVSIITPMFYKKAGYRKFNIISMLAFIGGNFLLSTITPNSSQMQIVLFLMILGIAMGCGAPALIGGSLRYLKDEKIGIASGVINMSRQIGVLLGIAIFVSVLNYQSEINFSMGKKEFVNDIQASATLSATAKKEMIDSVEKLTTQSHDAHKEDILNKIGQEKINRLKNIPKALQPGITKKFDSEISEVSNLIDEGTSTLKAKSSDGFSITFLYSSIFLILSLFFAFKTKPKQSLENKNLAS
ncbi:MAG: MFS transporter [Bacillota bacterium]|nr:MFS transporter [Bacillota bacterium]